MLTYLISSVEDLIATAVLLALVLAYAYLAWDRTGKRIILVGAGVGVVAAAVMAFMKQTTSKIDTGMWNMYLFVAMAIILLLALILFIKPIANKTGNVGKRIQQVLIAAFIALRIFYKLPDVFLYPFSFNLSDNSVLSTDFIFRVGGIVIGVVLIILLAFAAYKCARLMSQRNAGILAMAPAVILAVVQIMICLQTMLARRIIPSNHTLFTVVKWFSNSAEFFIFVILIIALIPIITVLWRSFNVHEPYSNPAQHRKIRARWRNYRRWAVCSFVCVIAAVLILTVVQDYNSRGPELSPAEECDVHDGACYVSFEQVEDGHLHRFNYITENGTAVRFIIIKKPNSSAYGIGLDACDICGVTGYYERDGQVVCKLCDVVMNINTIGFKGGCNPIPIDYSIEDGNIVLPTEGLEEYEDEFKNAKEVL